MKQIAFFIASSLLLLTVITGCSKSNSNSANLPDSANGENEIQTGDSDKDELSGTVVITGSTSVEKILVDMIDEFQALHPNVKVNYTGTGSSAGIADTLNGINTLGTSSREVKEEEKIENLENVVFAYDGIAVIVNNKNNITDISIEELAKIYSGEITNWNQIGGMDGEIVVVSREGASGTRTAFEELVKLEDHGGLVLNTTVVEGNGNVQLSVSGNENAIGYVSFSYVNDTIKAIKVEGVEATSENAKNGTYNLSRPFLLVYLKDKITPEAKAFLDYSISEAGQGYVEEHGGIKVN